MLYLPGILQRVSRANSFYSPNNLMQRQLLFHTPYKTGYRDAEITGLV